MVNTGKEKEQLYICQMSRQIVIPPFMQAGNSVRCRRQGILLIAAHPSIVERKCFMAAMGVMGIFRDMSIYIYKANLCAKAVCLPKYTIMASQTTALSPIMHARRHEPDTVNKPKRYEMTHVNKK